MAHTVRFRDSRNGGSCEKPKKALRYQISRGGRGGGKACLVTIRRASTAAMAARRSTRAPAERVGIKGMSGGVVAMPVGLTPTEIVAVTVLVAVAMTETLLEF